MSASLTMKALRLLLAVVLAVVGTASSYGQFEMIPGGLVNENDHTKNYVTYHYDGKSASELYDMVLTSIVGNYLPRTTMIDKIDNKMINLRCRYGVEFFKQHYYEFYYNLIFSFVDGEVMVKIPAEVDHVQNSDFSSTMIFFNKGNRKNFFEENVEIRYNKEKRKIEDLINKNIDLIMTGKGVYRYNYSYDG